MNLPVPCAHPSFVAAPPQSHARLVRRHEPTHRYVRFSIDGLDDVARASLYACTLIGCADDQTARITRSVVEALGSNIVRHASRGEIELRREGDELCVEARDEGPGIGDLEGVAPRDHESRMPRGLSRVRRLSSRFELYSSTRGTTARARIYIRTGELDQ